MAHTLLLGRPFDIRVGVHVSWLVVFALMTVGLARALGTLPSPQAYAFGAACALALFACVVAHELAHALVARRFGVRTSAITLFMFGGVATLEDEPASPRADALVAVAGPAMSALLAAGAFAVLVACDAVLPAGALHEALGQLGGYVVVANAVLACFNVVPAYPMDGGRVLRAVLWHRSRDRDAATGIAARVGIAFALLLVAAGVLVVAATHDAAYGWYVLLGAFLLRAGVAHERASRRKTSAPPASAALPA